LVTTFCAVAEDYLSDDAVSEEDEDEDAEEFGEGIAEVVSDATPE